jgi:protein tyrosine phosphatase (PTP) superfamily phosphohydrolase (DUF442 family)
MGMRMCREIVNFLEMPDSIATGGQPSEVEIEAIAQAGFEVVINLGLTGTDYALADEAGLVEKLGMRYIHIPVVWEAPTRADLDQFFEAMDANRDKKIFVHCALNMRVSVFMALYRILRLGWRYERAMKAVHGIWTPEGVWRTFIQDCLGENGNL